MSTFEVTGVRPFNNTVLGPVTPRLPVQVLARDGDMWDIYMLGLDAYQKKPENDPLSYYQISGIHGLPSMSP